MQSVQPSPRAAPTPHHRKLLAVAALLTVVVVVVALLVASGNGGGGGAGSTAPATVSEAALVKLASQSGVPAFWAGPRQGVTYEVTTSGEGREYVRYVPSGSSSAEHAAKLLTIGSYKVTNAEEAVRAIGHEPGGTVFDVPGGGIAAYTQARPTNVYVAYPGFAIEVEVFSPNAAEASALVREGQVEPISPVGAIATAPTGPRLVSADGLHSFAAANPFPVYWAGARADKSLELTRTIDGRVYVRYLPHGVRAGDPRPDYLTVGTYPVGSGPAAIQRAARTKGMTKLRLPNGNVVLYSASKPASAYFATPGSAEEVEVYSPQPGGAVALLAAGQIVPVK